MRRVWIGLLLLSTPLAGLGCGPDDEEACGNDAVDFSVSPARFTTTELEDGDGIPVYIPLQGGVFSEFDLRMWGIAESDVVDVDIRIANEDGVYSENSFQAQFLNLACSADGSVEIIDVPMSYDGYLDPEELNGIEVDFRVSVNDDPDYTREVSAVLVAY